MAGVGLVEAQLGPDFAVKLHIQATKAAAAIGQAVQRLEQSALLDTDRQQASRQAASAVDRSIDQNDALVDRLHGVGRVAFEASREAAQHQRDARQLLAEPVVQIAADALALAARGLEYFPLEALAFGDIAYRERDARADALALDQHRAVLEIARLSRRPGILIFIAHGLTAQQHMTELG